VSFTAFLVVVPCRNIKVKGLFKCNLRLMGERFPTIPTCGSESARGVAESVENLREGLIWSIDIRSVVHLVGFGVI
jgi:hypothetical protein